MLFHNEKKEGTLPRSYPSVGWDSLFKLKKISFSVDKKSDKLFLTFFYCTFALSVLFPWLTRQIKGGYKSNTKSMRAEKKS